MKKFNRNRTSKEINASSMADIAFLLLIFFLVTTTIVNDQGILVKLPPFDPNTPPATPPSKNVLKVNVNGTDELFVRNDIIELSELREMTKDFIMNPSKSADKPNKPTKAIVSLHHDRGTSYDLYLQVYNELKGAYNELWDEAAESRFGSRFEGLTKGQQKEIKQVIPMILSEAEPTDFITMNGNQ